LLLSKGLGFCLPDSSHCCNFLIELPCFFVSSFVAFAHSWASSVVALFIERMSFLALRGKQNCRRQFLTCGKKLFLCSVLCELLIAWSFIVFVVTEL